MSNIPKIPQNNISECFPWRDFFSKIRDALDAVSISTATTNNNASLNATKVVVMGDSLSAQNNNLSSCWPQLFNDLMWNSGAPVEVHNISTAGHSYFRANTVVQSNGNTMLQAAIALNPSLIFVVLGINDSVINVDGRSLAQTQTDADTIYSTLKAALPTCKIVYVSEIPFDTTNFTPVTCKNKGTFPANMTLRSSGILQGCYTPEILEDVVAAATQTALSNWQNLDLYIKGKSYIDGYINMNYWRCARLGLLNVDGLHPKYFGAHLLASYIVKGIKTLSFTPTMFPSLFAQTTPILYDPDSLFSASLTSSGDGYTPNTDTNAERVSSDLGNFELIDTTNWFYPYKTKFLKFPLTYSRDQVGMNAVLNGPPNSLIYTSDGGAAFVSSTVSTDPTGYFYNPSMGLPSGTYVRRYKTSNEIYGPFTIIVTDNPYVKARQIAAVTLTNGVLTTIPWDTIDTDLSSNWDAVNHQFVAPKSGKYQITCHLKGAGTAVSDGIIPGILKNGVRVVDGLGSVCAAASAPCWGTVSSTLILAVNDTIQIQGTAAGTTGTVPTAPGSANVGCVLTIDWLGN